MMPLSMPAPGASPDKSRSNLFRRPNAALLLTVLVVPVLAWTPPEVSARGTAVALLLIATAALLGLRRLDGRPLAVLAWTVPAAIGLAWLGELPGNAVAPLSTVGVAVLVWIVVRGQERPLPWIAAAAAIAAAGVAVHALAQRLGGLEALAARLGPGSGAPHHDAMLARLEEGRAFAGFVTPAALGGFIALVLPLTVGLALVRRGRLRVALLGLGVLQGSALVAAASATAAGALVAVTTGWLVVRHRWSRAAGVAVGLAALALVVVVALRGSALLDAGAANSPWKLRAGNFRIAAEMIGDHPWTGVGPGGYGEAYTRYRRASDNETRHAHDLPLELLAEYGVPAGAFLTLAFAAAVLGGWRRRPEGCPVPLHEGACLGVTAFGMQNLADFTAFFPSLLWLAVAIAAATRPTAVAQRMGAAALTGLATAGTAIALASLAAFSEDALFAARAAVLDGDRDAAALHAGRAVRLAPWSIDPLLFEAGMALDEQDLPRAAAAAGRAVDLAPRRPLARSLRARVRAARGDLPGAYADLIVAVREYPLAQRYRAELRLVERRLLRHQGAP